MSVEVINLKASDMTLPTGFSLYENAWNGIYAIGKLRVLHIGIKMVNPSSGSKNIGNFLPEGHRPRTSVAAHCETGLGDGKLQEISLQSTGSLNIFPVNTGTVTTYAIGSVAYVA